MKLLKQKAYEETKKRNIDQKESWLKDVANKIAISAFRF
jgi:hypothetical protein